MAETSASNWLSMMVQNGGAECSSGNELSYLTLPERQVDEAGYQYEAETAQSNVYNHPMDNAMSHFERYMHAVDEGSLPHGASSSYNRTTPNHDVDIARNNTNLSYFGNEAVEQQDEYSAGRSAWSGHPTPRSNSLPPIPEASTSKILTSVPSYETAVATSHLRVFTPSNESVLRLITNPGGSCNSCHQTCKGERAKIRHWLIHPLEEYAEMTKGRIPWNEGKILNADSKVNIAAACVSQCPRCRGSKLFGRKDSYLRHLERKHEINDRGEKNKEVKRLGNDSWTDAGARRAVWRLCHSI
ncbi:hypothetical protein K439DRAFT_558227 [Ramaria rubella]|nr:hypothetical protein K439DRAFT_558227 [Ramaria rubella]